jgi:two-component system, cell cycle sensor histidine kinase and response regulator CckA
MNREKTILLVDDKLLILNICKQVLELNGYRVLTASTPSEAIHESENYNGEIHLLLTDIMMPRVNGIELSKQLQTIRKNMKVLFMSGYPANYLADEGVDFDIRDLIQKPFTMDDLIRKVNSTLKK